MVVGLRSRNASSDRARVSRWVSREWREDKAHLGLILRPVSVWCGAHFFTGFCNIVGQGGSLHQGANEIVSDPMHRQLFENHPGGEAAQDIHAKHGFDLSEMQFDVPAPEIEFFQFLGWIKLRIEQGGDENDFFGAKTRNGNLIS